jgi:hypothetical protein
MCRKLPGALALMVLILVTACAPGVQPAGSPGPPLKPGLYVSESYRAPGINPGNLTCFLEPFAGAAAHGPEETFSRLFQEELLRAWQTQGLNLGPSESPCRLSGVIHQLTIRGSRLRRFTGRLHARLVLAGALQQDDRVLFAFRDEVQASSPVAPGPAAPREQELLLRFLAREAANRLLNELLLGRESPPPE